MIKRTTPTILKVLGCIVIVYGIYGIYIDLRFVVPVIIYGGFPFFMSPSFLLYRAFSIAMTVLLFMGGRAILSGQKDTIDKFKKYGVAFFVLYIFLIIFSWVTSDYFDMPIVLFTLFRLVLGYFVILVIMIKNKSLKNYFENIDRKKVKIIKIKKSIIENTENIIITEERKDEKTLGIENEKIEISNVINSEKDESTDENKNSENEKVEERDIKTYKFKNGLIKSYYENGSLKLEETYVNNILEGRTIGYHINGRIKSIGYYNNGKKTGKWKYYSESGIDLEDEKE